MCGQPWGRNDWQGWYVILRDLCDCIIRRARAAVVWRKQRLSESLGSGRLGDNQKRSLDVGAAPAFDFPGRSHTLGYKYLENRDTAGTSTRSAHETPNVPSPRKKVPHKSWARATCGLPRAPVPRDPRAVLA